MSSLSMSRKLDSAVTSKVESPSKGELLLGTIIQIIGIDFTKMTQILETKSVSHRKLQRTWANPFGLLSKSFVIYSHVFVCVCEKEREML